MLSIGRIFSVTDHPPLAAALMVFALSLLSLQDVVIKLTTGDVSIWQFQFVRAGFNLSLLVGGVLLFGGLKTLPPKRAWVVALRSVCLVGAMMCFFAGVPFLNLAEIAAGLYLFPLIVTLLSRVVLGEQVGIQRLTAVAAGFCGSLLILKPAGDDFRLISLLPVCAAMFYACMVLITRRLCRDESPLTLASGVALMFMLVGAIGLAVMPPPDEATALAKSWPYLLTGWHDLGLLTLFAIASCSVLNLCANICLARAYQTAESSWLAPYDYSYLVFAALWGYLIWGTVPDVLTVAGMSLIAGAGIFVAARAARGA
ncbi:MAG: DMT family transporter [Hyphomicrobiaceae bacterium]